MLKLHPILGNHMVLQQGANNSVTGTANPGENLTVTFAGVSREVVAGDSGKWKCQLGHIGYGGPFHLEVLGGSERVALRDIFVGEVWLCSGQSNMDQRVAKGSFHWCGVNNEAEEIASAQYPLIRLYSVRLQLSVTPCESLADESTQFIDRNAPPYSGEWTICSSETVGAFSAEAYFFARELQRSLKVPIGIITSCYGASTAQGWISRERLGADPDLKILIDEFEQSCVEFESGESHAKYLRDLADWRIAEKRRSLEGVKLPRHLRRRPKNPKDPRCDQHSPTLLYNGMISPLFPCSIAGIIWHHGESNQPTANKYLALLRELIDDWRILLARDCPFLIVQMPNVNEPEDKPVGRGRISYIREAQFDALTIPNVGLIVTIDIGTTNAHSHNKLDIGRRLSLCARALRYGQEVAYSGPVFEYAVFDGAHAMLHFRHCEGLYFSSGEKQIAVAADSGDFEWAEVRIVEDSVLVRHPTGRQAVAIRYGWAENPRTVLYNKHGLPASPFRTDRAKECTRLSEC